ncbi:MAG: efflux RND transporter permease subunit [Campylobacterota bacterium]
MIKKIYDKIVFKFPIAVIALTLIAIGILGFYSTKLEIDASAETLLLENDQDLQFYREVNKTYHNPDFLIVAFTPNKKLLSQESLNTIRSMSEEFLKIDEINSITSILNVPLFQSPIKPLSSIVDGVKTLEDGSFDKKLVKKEFLNSELYTNNLVSKDFTTTAIVLNLKENKKYQELVEKRRLYKKQNDEKKLETIQEEIRQYTKLQKDLQSEYIAQIREVIKQHESYGKLFLGGVSMIANDIIGYIKSDLIIYGSSLIILLTLILWIIFRKLRWVVLPLFICLLSVVSTTGILGLLNLKVTVISSNFISLQLIITLSIVLHLIVRFKELEDKYPNSNNYKLTLNTILSKISPSFFAILTTIVGFSSLIFSNIKPVINLGLMMSAGIAISLIISFVIFPAILILLKNQKSKELKTDFSLIQLCINIVLKRKFAIFFVSIILVIFALTGSSKLIVENSFINYFKKDTQIYKGMKVIDEKLGGTTPLDVIINFKDKTIETKKQEKQSSDDSFGDFSSFEDEFASAKNEEQYWFTQDKLDTITKVHNYLDSLDTVGKVQSLATTLKLGKLLNGGEPLDSVTLALLYNKLPQEYKDIILTPYINISQNEARVTVRINDSNPDLRRNELLEKIETDLSKMIENDYTSFRLSNLMVLYNNMLQSLFDSQIKTLGFVVGIIFIMFLLIFRSLKIAIIAIVSNLVPISIVFGIMGWLGIPLDIMTITIAAISIGIGVDDTIHYIHRFKEEFRHDNNYERSMKRTHKSIGYAMTYTSFVVIVGFSILVLSNLVPTIYFGLLTVIVMATILTSALLLLPRLLIHFKPLGK